MMLLLSVIWLFNVQANRLISPRVGPKISPYENGEIGREKPFI